MFCEIGYRDATCRSAAAFAHYPVLSAAAAKFDDYSGVGVVKHISYDVLKTITLERTRARAHTCARSGCHVSCAGRGAGGRGANLMTRTLQTRAAAMGPRMVIQC